MKRTKWQLRFLNARDLLVDAASLVFFLALWAGLIWFVYIGLRLLEEVTGAPFFLFIPIGYLLLFDIHYKGEKKWGLSITLKAGVILLFGIFVITHKMDWLVKIYLDFILSWPSIFDSILEITG